MTLGANMKGPIRNTIAGCVLLATMGLAADAQNARVTGDESARILSLENSWNQAEVKHDIGAMGLLIADVFEYTDDDGTFMNRSQWMAHVKNGVDLYEELPNSEVLVHIHGNVAIVTGKYHERIKVKGKPVVLSGRFTDTWIQENTGWKCVAS